MRLSQRSTIVLCMVLLAGCDSSGPATPTLDTDSQVIDAVTGGMSTYSVGWRPYLMSGGFAPLLRLTLPSACAYDGATQFFVCPVVDRSGLVVTRRFQLLDASGAVLSVQDPSAVAAVHSIVDVNGTTLSSEFGALTGTYIARHEDATLSGLQMAARTLNATATTKTIQSLSGGSFTINDTTVVTGLQLMHAIDRRYPLSGTIVSQGTMDFSTGATAYRRELAFDGSSVVVYTRTMFGATSTCRIDLAPGAGSFFTCS